MFGRIRSEFQCLEGQEFYVELKFLEGGHSEFKLLERHNLDFKCLENKNRNLNV